MTLIGRLRFSGFPVMIGDILLSRTDRPHPHPVALPAMLDVNAHLPEEAWGSVSGVTQKLNILNDSLMVAWAGSYLQARLALRHLDEAVRAGASTSQDICFALDAIAGEIGDLSLLGLVVRPDGRPDGVAVASFAWDVGTDELDGVDVRLAGTGQWHARELLPRVLQLSDKLTPLEQAIYTGIGLGGALVGRETDTRLNLVEMWGGAIEIGFVANGRIQKLDRVLHMQARVARVADGLVQFQLWPKFTHYSYLGEYLLVATIEWTTAAGPAVEELHVVSPLLRHTPPPIDGAREPADFAHDYLCCYVAFEDGLSDDAYMVLAMATPQNQLSVVREGSTTSLRCEPALLKHLIDQTRPCIKAGYRYE